jgi:hypothetical protein
MVMVPSFLGMEGGQQQHASEHSDGCEQQMPGAVHMKSAVDPSPAM